MKFDDIIDVFLSSTSNEFLKLIEKESTYEQLRDPKIFLDFGKQLKREGYYSELTEFLDHASTQKHIFNDAEEKVADNFLILYIASFYYLGNYDKLISVCEKYLELFPHSLEVKLTALGGIAVASKQQSDYQKAFEHQYQIIYSINRSENPSKYKYDYYLAITNIAIIFHELENYNVAHKLYSHALEYAKKVDEKIDKTNISICISMCLSQMGRNKEALNIIDRSINKYKLLKAELDLMSYQLLRLHKAYYLLQLEELSTAKDIIDDFTPIKKNTEKLTKVHAIRCYLSYLYLNTNYNQFLKEFQKEYPFLLDNNDPFIFNEIIEYAFMIADKINDKTLKLQLHEIKDDFKSRNSNRKIEFDDTVLEQELEIVL